MYRILNLMIFTLLMIFISTACGVKSSPGFPSNQAIPSYIESFTHEKFQESDTNRKTNDVGNKKLK